jgi:hypothetical protein
MPSRKIHNTIAKLFFPYISYEKIDEINRVIDSAYFINPRKHREMLGHSKEAGLALTNITRDPNTLLLWALHVWLDKNFKTKR